jgi:hypothetical protein
MDKIIKFIASNAIGIILIIIVLALAFGGGSAVYKKIGALEESERNTAQQVVALTESNQLLQKQNIELLRDNAEIKATSEKTNAELRAGMESLKKQAEARPAFPPECTEIVNYMQGEIDNWAKQFSLAIKDRDDWKQSSSNFELAYNNQVIITTNVQNMRDLEFKDSLKKTEIIKDLQHKLNFNKYEKIGGIVLFTLVVISLVK